MTEEQQLQHIAAALADWARRHGGTVHLAHDRLHLLKILGAQPGAPRVGILFAGETPRHEQYADLTNRVDRRFWIGLSRGWTLESYPGKSLVESTAGGAPLLQLLREVRTALRALRFTAASEPIPYYQGCELLTFEGHTLDAYRLEIIVASDLSAE